MLKEKLSSGQVTLGAWLTLGTSEMSQETDIFDVFLILLLIISLLNNVRCNENSLVEFLCSMSRINFTFDHFT